MVRDSTRLDHSRGRPVDFHAKVEGATTSEPSLAHRCSTRCDSICAVLHKYCILEPRAYLVDADEALGPKLSPVELAFEIKSSCSSYGFAFARSEDSHFVCRSRRGSAVLSLVVVKRLSLVRPKMIVDSDCAQVP